MFVAQDEMRVDNSIQCVCIFLLPNIDKFLFEWIRCAGWMNAVFISATVINNNDNTFS